MRKMIGATVVAVTLLTGCMGVTKYEIQTPDGVIVKAKNTKDYQSYKLVAEKQADGSYKVELTEEGVSASDPLKAAQEANAKLIEKLLGVLP